MEIKSSTVVYDSIVIAVSPKDNDFKEQASKIAEKFGTSSDEKLQTLTKGDDNIQIFAKGKIIIICKEQGVKLRVVNAFLRTTHSLVVDVEEQTNITKEKKKLENLLLACMVTLLNYLYLKL
jgi:hypothetical protein